MQPHRSKIQTIRRRDGFVPVRQVAASVAIVLGLACYNGCCLAAMSDFINEAQFNSYFPQHNKIFNFNDFSAAVSTYYPAFASTGTPEQQAQELAAFLANAAQETDGSGPNQFDAGLYFPNEPCAAGCPQFSTPGWGFDGEQWVEWYPAPGGTYQGRGALQLTYVYNYGPANKNLQALDPTLPNIFDHPELVTTTPAVSAQNMAWLTALWFWFTPQTPKPSCHQVMTGGWTPNEQDTALGREPGFAMTEVIINGGVQCDVYEITQASVSKGAGGLLDRLSFTINRPNNTLLQGSLLYLENASNSGYNGRYTVVSGTAGAEEFTVVADAKQVGGSTPRSLKDLPALTSGSIGAYFGYLTRERRIDWYNHLTGPNYINVSPGAAIDCSTMVPYIPFLPD